VAALVGERGSLTTRHALDRHPSTGQLAYRAPVVGLRGSSRQFGGDALELGLLFAAYGAGSLAGVLLAGSVRRPRRFGSIVLTLVILMGVGLAAIGFAPSILAAGFILLGVGAMNGYVNIVIIAWVQGRTDPLMLGRTMSFMMLGWVVAAPLSLAIAAVVVDSHATGMFLVAGLSSSAPVSPSSSLSYHLRATMRP
jgi:MFS family permease